MLCDLEREPYYKGIWLVGILLFSVLFAYSIFPSESSQERFTLILRVALLGSVALFSIAAFPLSRPGWIYFPLFCFLIVLSLLLSNYPHIPTRTINVVVVVLLSAVFISRIASSTARLFVIHVVNILLFVSFACVLFQIGYYFASGSVIEIHQLFFPWSESRSTMLERFGIVRVSGLHTEPGTHSAYTVGLLIFRTLLGRKLFDWISLISMLSVAATLSFWGIAASLMYFISFVLHSGNLTENLFRWALMLIIGLLISAGILSIYLYSADSLAPIIDYFTFRSELGDGSGGAKVSAWDYGLRTLADTIMFGLPFNEDYCNGCQSPQDAGLILNLAIYFGVCLCVLLYGVYVLATLRTNGLWLIPFASLFFVAKFFYYDPLVWMIFFLSVLLVTEKSRVEPEVEYSAI